MEDRASLYREQRRALERVAEPRLLTTAAAGLRGAAPVSVTGENVAETAVWGAGQWGLECSIDAAEIVVAPGDAWCLGVQFIGDTTLDFTGLGAGVYHVFAASTGDPYQADTADVADTDLPLCTVTWSGSALSALTDLRTWA
jgi:hypothetical protein